MGGFSELGPEAPSFDHFRDIWALTQDPNRSFETKLELLFATETDTLSLPYGFLTRIDPTADQQEIVAAHGTHELLQPGETGPLSESYCRHSLKTAADAFRIDDAHAENWTDDPAYDRFQLAELRR